MKKFVLRGMVVLLLVGGVLVVNAVWFEPFFIRAFYERVFIEFAFDSPEILTNLHMVEQFGMQAHNKELIDYSEIEYSRQAERLRHNLVVLHSYDTSGQELEPMFDQRDFHEVMLENSAMPLTLLEQVVNRSISLHRNS